MLGGYQIIDCRGLDLTTVDGVTIAGAYKKATAKKAILLENVNISSLAIGGVFTFAIDGGEGSVVIPLSVTDGEAIIDTIITITSEDVITCTIIE